MKKIFSSINARFIGFLAFALCFMTSMPAWATAPSLTLPTSIDLTQVYAVASLMLVAVAAIWGIKKVVAFFGR